MTELTQNVVNEFDENEALRKVLRPDWCDYVKEYYEADGTPKVTLYQIYLGLYRKLRVAKLDNEMKRFGIILNGIWDIISMFDCKSLEKECQDEIKAYLKKNKTC